MKTMKQLFPKNEQLKTKFKCDKCKKTFLGGDCKLEKPLPNFHTPGISGWMMECPKCGYRTMFGFNVA